MFQQKRIINVQAIFFIMREELALSRWQWFLTVQGLVTILLADLLGHLLGHVHAVLHGDFLADFQGHLNGSLGKVEVMTSSLFYNVWVQCSLSPAWGPGRTSCPRWARTWSRRRSWWCPCTESWALSGTWALLRSEESSQECCCRPAA